MTRPVDKIEGSVMPRSDTAAAPETWRDPARPAGDSGWRTC